MHMSEDDGDRFQKVDKAIERVRAELDEAVDETKEAGQKARREAREAIDDLEARIDALRKRDEE